MIDRKGVIYKGRDNLNHWKSAHAIKTKSRTLDQAIKGADVFLGLSAKGILTKKMVRYNVIPIGINTTIPAIKLFLSLAKIDFFILFFDIYQE